MPQAKGFYTTFFFLLYCGVNPCAASQDLQVLEHEALQYLLQHYQNQAEKVVINVSTLDKRLRLENCTGALSFTLRDAAGTGGAVSLKAQCQGAKPWSLYMAARVALHHRVLVASHSMSRGELLRANNIETVLMDTSTLRGGYLTESDNAIGKQLRRSVQRLEPLRQGLLEAPIVVKRGDEVRLIVSSGTITVAAKATALASGRVGERIRVRNSSSKRIISAHVTAIGEVSATF